jgi:CheY-like chemotaxis protein
MDIQLPLLDGYEATRRIKADQALKHIPIIVVTSHALSGARPRRAPPAATPMWASLTAQRHSSPKSANTLLDTVSIAH